MWGLLVFFGIEQGITGGDLAGLAWNLHEKQKGKKPTIVIDVAQLKVHMVPYFLVLKCNLLYFYTT